MHTTTARHLEFAPPPPPGTGRSLSASLLVHTLLVVALTAGINWNRDNTLSAEAELWSAVPQAAAPKLVEVEPPPPPPPPPKAVAKPAPPPAPDREAEIALAKRRKAQEEAKKLEAQREKERLKLEEQKKAEEKKQKELKDKLKAEEQKRKLDAKREQERKEKEQRDKEAKKQQELKERQAAEEAKKLDAIRKDNLKRIAGLAGASGDANATGTAMKSAGPSDSYAGRIRGKVKPNIVFTEEVTSNSAAEVEVRCAPDGTIVGRKLLKSSGNKAWDDAVLKAIDKTEILPRDVDGRIFPSLIISFKPRD